MIYQIISIDRRFEFEALLIGKAHVKVDFILIETVNTYIYVTYTNV